MPATACRAPSVVTRSADARRALRPIALLLLATAVAGPGHAQQSANAILSAVRDQYDRRVSDVDNYTIVQEVDGQRQVAYYERREKDGAISFAAVGPFGMLIESGALDEMLGVSGGVLPTLKNALEQSAGSAGLSELQQEVQGMGGGVFADFVGPLLTPEPGQSPDAELSSLTSKEHLKSALIEGAKRAALHEVEKTLLNAAAPQLGLLLQALQSPGGGSEMLHRLGGMLAKGQLPLPGQAFGQQGGSAPGASGGETTVMGGLMNVAARAAGAAMVKKTVGAAKGIDAAPSMSNLDPPPDELFADLADHADVTGTEQVDGHDCWVLTSSDTEGLGDAVPDDFRSPKLTVWVDRDLSVPRQLRMEGEVKMNGDWSPMVMETRHGDFREAEGLLLPYRTTTTISGMSTAVPADKRKEMEKQMAEMQKQLAKMPAQQRAMAEQMMKARMPQLQAMLGASEAPVETVVKKVTVNQGPPEELVAEAKAMMQRGG